MSDSTNITLKRGLFFDEPDSFHFRAPSDGDGTTEASIELTNATVGAIRSEHLDNYFEQPVLDFTATGDEYEHNPSEPIIRECAILDFALTGDWNF